MNKPAVWFPAIRTGSGTDIFTEQLVHELNKHGVRAEISWLPHHAEYLPWIVPKPVKPNWANLIHVNTWLPSHFLPQCTPIIATLHHCVQDPAFRPYKTLTQHLYHQLWITPIERKILNLATKVTAVSQYTATCARQIFHRDDIDVIYNGIDTDIFQPIKKTPSQHHPFRLLFIGNNSRRKGFDLLPEIMQYLGSDFELRYLGGRGKKIEKIPANMLALPRLKDIRQAYQNADALLFPSRLEGFGLVVAEAMACGLPVVIANSSALTELVDHGVTGFLCEKDNINQFVQTIKYLKKHPELCTTVGKSARDTSIAKFNINDMVKNYIITYQSVLNPN